MNKWQMMVRKFHKKFGQPISKKPTLQTPERANLRCKLLLEEYEETDDALFRDNMVGIADGLADLIYVALGTAVEYGIDLDPIFKEVHRSNMEKQPGLLRDDGKIIKPEGWKPPRIKEILDAQLR